MTRLFMVAVWLEFSTVAATRRFAEEHMTCRMRCKYKG